MIASPTAAVPDDTTTGTRVAPVEARSSGSGGAPGTTSCTAASEAGSAANTSTAPSRVAASNCPRETDTAASPSTPGTSVPAATSSAVRPSEVMRASAPTSSQDAVRSPRWAVPETITPRTQVEIASRTTRTGSVPATWSRPERAAPRKVTAPLRREARSASRRSGRGASRATSTAVTSPMSSGAAASRGSGEVSSASGETAPLVATAGGARPRWRSVATAATAARTSTPSATSRRRPEVDRAPSPPTPSRRRPRRPSAPPSRVPTAASTGSSSTGASPSTAGSAQPGRPGLARHRPGGDRGAQRGGGQPEQRALEQRHQHHLPGRAAAGHQQRQRPPPPLDHQPGGEGEDGERDPEQPGRDERDDGRRRPPLPQVVEHETVQAAGQPQVRRREEEEVGAEAGRAGHREDLALQAPHLREQLGRLRGPDLARPQRHPHLHLRLVGVRHLARERRRGLGRDQQGGGVDDPVAVGVALGRVEQRVVELPVRVRGVQRLHHAGHARGQPLVQRDHRARLQAVHPRALGRHRHLDQRAAVRGAAGVGLRRPSTRGRGWSPTSVGGLPAT